LVGRDLLKANAVALSPRLFWAQKDSGLDDFPAVGLTLRLATMNRRAAGC
jgi:hypothetical protein